MNLLIYLSLITFSTFSSGNECIVEAIESSYNYENEKTVIKRNEDVLIVTLIYSDSAKNIIGEKIITFDLKGKKYQYESYYRDLVINPKKYRGTMDNFGKGKWIDINFSQTNSLYLRIYNCEYATKN
jgi:hypothetical protein